MNEALHMALVGRIIVEQSENRLYEIMGLHEIRDGSVGPDTMVVAREVRGSEMLLDLLSEIRDPDAFKVFADLASATAWVEKQKGEEESDGRN